MLPFCRFAVLPLITLSLCSCVLGLVAGSQVGVEAVTEEILPEYKKSGSDLQKMAKWGAVQTKPTYSTSGKEAWSCADMLEGKWDDTGAYQYICLASNDKLVANETYICKEGKGGIVSMAVNKASHQTIFCQKLIPKK